jgi:type II secretion system protein I
MFLNRKNKHLNFHKLEGFTLMEVLIALAITAIGLIPLLHLLVSSISMMDSASCLSYASILANEKLAETVSGGYPEPGTESGILDRGGSNIPYKWQIDITDAPQDELEDLHLSDLRKVNVCVFWNQGRTKKQVSVSTLISPERAVTEMLSKTMAVK